MDLYSLTSCIPISINRFTQKCDCFQNHSDIFFICQPYYNVGKNKWQYVNHLPNHEYIFLKQNFTGNFSFVP